jgi:hypothetical protein
MALLLSADQPLWLTQPPSKLLMKAEGQHSFEAPINLYGSHSHLHGIPTPRSKNGERERERESVNEMSENNNSPMIRHFRMYPCISPLQKGRYRDTF